MSTASKETREEQLELAGVLMSQGVVAAIALLEREGSGPRVQVATDVLRLARDRWAQTYEAIPAMSDEART